MSNEPEFEIKSCPLNSSDNDCAYDLCELFSTRTEECSISLIAISLAKIAAKTDII